MHGIFIGEIGVATRVLFVNGSFESIHALGAYDGARSAFVTAAEHAFAEHAGNHTSNFAHRFQFGAGNLVVVAQTKAVPAKDVADGGDVAGLPGIQHLMEALL